MVRAHHRYWHIGTLLWLSAESRIGIRDLTLLFRAHRAMVFAVATAARRQVRFALRCQSEERAGKWQTKDGQQRDGDELAQYLYLSTIEFRSQDKAAA